MLVCFLKSGITRNIIAELLLPNKLVENNDKESLCMSMQIHCAVYLSMRFRINFLAAMVEA